MKPAASMAKATTIPVDPSNMSLFIQMIRSFSRQPLAGER